MKKIKMKVTDQEHRLIIYALNELRNEQIRQNKITEPINELLLKLI